MLVRAFYELLPSILLWNVLTVSYSLQSFKGGVEAYDILKGNEV